MLRDDPRGLEGVDESPLAGELPLRYVQRVCRDKAAAAWESMQSRGLPVAPVLAADTTVTLDGQILGKPEDRNEAMRMLKMLAGRQHEVLTAVAMKLGDREEGCVSHTTVTFTSLSDARIETYLASGEADDKAGAYGIQGLAGTFVSRIEGSYSGVVGLPLFETTELLQLFGYDIP